MCTLSDDNKIQNFEQVKEAFPSNIALKIKYNGLKIFTASISSYLENVLVKIEKKEKKIRNSNISFFYTFYCALYFLTSKIDL